MNISLPADLIPDKVQRGKFELLRKHNRVIEFLNANRFYFISISRATHHKKEYLSSLLKLDSSNRNASFRDYYVFQFTNRPLRFKIL